MFTLITLTTLTMVPTLTNPLPPGEALSHPKEGVVEWELQRNSNKKVGRGIFTHLSILINFQCIYRQI